MSKWFHPSAGAKVESFLVQASYPVAHLHQTRGQTLVRHLLSRFQADSSAEEEQTGSRTLFACAAAGLPPVFASVMLYPAYHPITIVPTYRPYWGQVGDEYLFVLYAFVAMGVAAIVLWESIFPDLLDVFALGVLPLSSHMLLRARWKAVAFVFGLVLLCVVAPGAVLLPAVAEENFLRQLCGPRGQRRRRRPFRLCLAARVAGDAGNCTRHTTGQAVHAYPSGRGAPCLVCPAWEYP